MTLLLQKYLIRLIEISRVKETSFFQNLLAFVQLWSKSSKSLNRRGPSEVACSEKRVRF